MRRISEFNLFKTRSSDPNIIQRQILTTRLFIVFFTMALIILLTYASITERIQIKKIQQPSLTTFQQLILYYPNTLQCPCQHISILPSRFVTTSPRFHQVCSSDFISQPWIDFTFIDNLNYIYPMDIRTYFSAMWQIIASLCQSARDTITDALTDFENEHFVSFQVLSETLLETHIRSKLDGVRRLATESFTRDLLTTNTITHVDGLMAGRMTNFVGIVVDSPLLLHNASVNFLIQEQTYRFFKNKTSCSCYKQQSCPSPGGLYHLNRLDIDDDIDLTKLTANITIPGIISDCLPIVTTFASSLECFYNRTCIEVLERVYARSINVSILNKTQSSRFPITTPLRKIIEELFLEEISNSTSFSAYYNECTPISCTYTYTRRFDRIFIITTLVGLVGGLNAALRLIIPYLIDFGLFIKSKWLRPRKRIVSVIDTNDDPAVPIWRKLWIQIRRIALESNMFSNDPHYYLDDHQGRLTTRAYFILMSLLLIILIIYTDQTRQKFTITLESPSYQQYQRIQARYSDNLHCACSNISIPYRDFLRITLTYHQLCSSGFVQSEWYQKVTSRLPIIIFFTFKRIASFYFGALSLLCALASDIFDTSYDRFLSTTLVHRELMPRISFNKQIDRSIETFLKTVHSDFLHKVELINSFLHVDEYMSGLEINAYFRLNRVDNASTSNPYRFYSEFRKYNDIFVNTCDFLKITDYTMIIGFDTTYYDPNVTIQCSTMNTALKSTLACWFDERCTHSFLLSVLFASEDGITNISTLDNARSSRFSTDEKVENIVKEFMIEYYKISISYERYYEQCHPSSCSYTFDDKSNLIYIVTTIIGLFGGLNIVLRLICPPLVKLYFRKKRRMHRIPSVTKAHPDQRPSAENQRSYLRWKNHLLKLNLFANGSNNIEILRRQRISTRIYLLLLLITNTVIVLYTIVPTPRTYLQIESPSLSEYQELLLQYGSSLSCPCNQISIAKKDLLTISATHHQICSSDLVDPLWLSTTSNDNFSFSQVHDDFRVLFGVYFRMLSTSCTHAQAATDRAIGEFLSESFLSSSAISPLQFSSRMEEIIIQFEKLAASDFIRMVNLLRSYLHGNTFISIYSLNWYVWTAQIRDYEPMSASPMVYDNGCSCGTRSDCFSARPFHPTIPGFVIGCSVTEGVLKSSLISLYNQTLLDNVVSLFYGNSSRKFFLKSLNRSLPSRYELNSSVHDLINNLLVEKWSFNASYGSFYHECRPRHCTVLTEKRNSFLLVVSRLLGFYGGLTVSCRYLVLHTMQLWTKTKAFLHHRRVGSF